MSETTTSPFYSATLVPALQRIQHKFGYLQREAMEEYALKSGIPRYRLQAVASFFPHFQLTPPKKVIVKVCRDMACHLNGSAKILKDLATSCGDDVTVSGVSCLGRCDRPPAACVSVLGGEHEHYYLARNADSLRGIVQSALHGDPPPQDSDEAQPYACKNWVIDSYEGEPPAYAGVRKAVAIRNESLKKSGQFLAAQKGWGLDRVEQFTLAAIRQGRVDYTLVPEVKQAVLDWQTEAEWAKGPEMGGWSETLLAELKAADLRGLGGAGIPSIQKWRDVRDAVRTARLRAKDDRAFIVVNGDESEPATFKDRELLLKAPHTVLEGVILAGLIAEATQGFIYIRHEYEEQIEACRAEIRRAEQMGICGENASVLGRSFPVSVFVSPGGYICGEQSALIEAMSDRRGEPRNMPPKLETNGLIDLPTLVSNVETYAWAPYIMIKGGKTYAEHGMNGCQGQRFFSISGDINRPGVYEVPMGLTLGELINGQNYCQGILGGRALKAFAPSGPSGGFLPAKLRADFGLPRKFAENPVFQEICKRKGLDPATTTEVDIQDMPLELNVFRALSPTQALGAGIVVYAEGRDMAVEMLNSLEFYRNESCGKCVPCRVGSQKFVSLATNLLERKIGAQRWNGELVPLVRELGKAIELASICGLGRSVPVPLLTTISFFEPDVEKYLGGHA